jgi:hypothetical protein
MQVYELLSAEGEPHAFEVSSLLLTRSQACAVAGAIPGARITKRSHLFRDSSVFCTFTIGAAEYSIEEPYGDNSRYWIGTKDGRPSQSLALVRAAFQGHRAWLPPLRTFLAAAAVLVGALLYSKASQFLAQDNCLDTGGRWESSSSTCTHVAQ